MIRPSRPKELEIRGTKDLTIPDDPVEVEPD